MLHSEGRILTTHVGALPRSVELEQKIQAHRLDESVPLDGLREEVARSVRDQLAAGVDIVNDGELGKPGWAWYAWERLSGFEPRPMDPSGLFRGHDRAQFAEFYEEAGRSGTLWHGQTDAIVLETFSRQPVCRAPIAYRPEAVQRDIANLKAALEGTGVQEAFLPVAAPSSVEIGLANEYYPSQEEFVGALADALREEYEAIVAAGFVLQVDDAWVPALWDAMLPDIDMDTYRAYVNVRIDALNHALSNVPEDRVRYHVCWGSWHGPHSGDIPMEVFAEFMLRVKAQAYLFEAANVRHEHEYHVWDSVSLPAGKILAPGVVSHATNVLEHPELVAERILRFAERVGRENVIASTDCGLGGRIHPQLVWAKLRVMAEGARLASERLWGAPVGGRA
ncbi:MAG: cobalamin-independent methionine synthase II family protein [bacterium]|jgi:5-methyltetrahydropteroyltriglutamate--homocysteine methyltransferase|nr:cobalamin-independent methionine synthase II family protein [bacterium]